jgi:dTDP-4-dehydrorhamnose 3,5-epimerase
VIFLPTGLPGCFVVEIEPIADERGFFARTFSTEEFDRMGLDPTVVDCSISYNPRRGTLRGLHFQAAPHGEAKLVRCPRGRVFDVAVDLRPGSATRLLWTAAELSAENRRSLYIPPGFAHGFVTLRDDTEVSYQMSYHHVPEAASGLRWDDPTLGIAWPELSGDTLTISSRDRSWPLLEESGVSDRSR